MSDSRAILLRLSVRDADVVRRELVAMGEQGSAALARLDAAAKAAGGSGAGASGGGFGGLRGAIGQAGFQIQDFAVQVQGGTSALTALSQQGSQLLGIFGPAGAIAGAALTVGILAMKLLDLSGASETAAEAEAKHRDAISSSRDVYEDAIQRADRLAEARRGAALAGIEERAEAERTNLRNLNRDLRAFEENLAFQRDRMAGRGGGGAAADNPLVVAERQRLAQEAERISARLAELDVERLRIRATVVPGGGVYGPEPPSRATDPRPGRGIEAGTPDQIRNTLMQLRSQEDERLRREVERFTQGVERPLDAYKRRVQEIENLAARARENGNPIPEEAIQRATDEALGQFNNLARGMEQSNLLGQQLGMTFNSAFEDMIVKGRSFREVLGGIAQDLARLVVRQSITAPLGNMLTKAIGGFDFGSIFSFGGGKAVGGPVMGGTTYLVGERGPELFMPAANGNIVPNHALGGVTIQQTVNINAQGAGPREIDVLRAQIPGMVRQTALAAVEDASRRGGGFARNVRGG